MSRRPPPVPLTFPRKPRQRKIGPDAAQPPDVQEAPSEGSNPQLSFRLPQVWIDAFQALAKRKLTTTSQLLRDHVMESVEREDREREGSRKGRSEGNK